MYEYDDILIFLMGILMIVGLGLIVLVMLLILCVDGWIECSVVLGFLVVILLLMMILLLLVVLLMKLFGYWLEVMIMCVFGVIFVVLVV